MLVNLNFGGIDYIFLLLLILLAGNSFLKGFIHEAISIIVLTFAAIIGYKLQSYIAGFLNLYISLPTFLPIFSFIITFFASYFVLSLLAQSLTKRLQITVGVTDRFLGIIFGCLKAFFIILIFYIVINLIIPITNQPNFLTNSFFREIVSPIEKQLFYNLNSDNMKPKLNN